MSETFYTWYQTEFQPWQEQMRARAQEEARRLAPALQNVTALKTLVGLVLDSKAKEAAKLWNSLGFSPNMRCIELDTAAEMVRFETAEGEARTVALDDLLADIEKLINGAAGGSKGLGK